MWDDRSSTAKPRKEIVEEERPLAERGRIPDKHGGQTEAGRSRARRRCSRSRRCECFLHDPSLAFGSLCSMAWPRIPATALCQRARSEGNCSAVCCSRSHWSFSWGWFSFRANCGIHRGPVLRDWKIKKRLIVLAVIAVALLLAFVNLWGPSSAPRGQEPLVALSNVNFSDFKNAFDGDLATPRLVLLLSPT